ncbi:hypothetical protein TNCT_738231 [Trichonephila clavata]|uniref:Uncharacterized protein n=1 Tax=Trichonephila clavata TaxID=2740835 RepID=A0A8X6KE06_TRICU|nr:hypothetical protein TNCT_738231 [Trichonephila clavata]
MGKDGGGDRKAVTSAPGTVRPGRKGDFAFPTPHCLDYSPKDLYPNVLLSMSVRVILNMYLILHNTVESITQIISLHFEKDFMRNIITGAVFN